MKKFLFGIFLMFISTFTNSQTIQDTRGDNSPIISNVHGNVNYTVTIIGKKPTAKKVTVLDIVLPRNSEEEESNTKTLLKFFDDLNKLNGQIIYIRFSTYVGAGIGIEDVPKNRSIRAGVVFDLTGSEVLDGFGGERDNYEYAYSVELNKYRDAWSRSIQSTLLFPKKGNAFFDVHYMKSMTFEGLAKVKVSGMQGFQWIEIIPAEPFGDLKEQYDEIRAEMMKHAIGTFEF